MTHDTPPALPRPMDLAVKLMYVGGALAFLYNLLRVVQRDAIAEAVRQRLGDAEGAAEAVEKIQHSGVALIVVGLITAGVWVLMARMCAQGHAWARIVSTLFGVLGMISACMSLFTGLYLPLTLLSAAMGIVAALVIALLWRPESSRFFRW